MKQLCEYIECRVVNTKLYIQFLLIQKFRKMHFINRKHMVPGAKTSPRMMFNLTVMRWNSTTTGAQ